MRALALQPPIKPAMFGIRRSSSASDTVERAQQGDVAAFKAIYRSNVGRVHALCLRMVGDRSTAETLTQDVFVRAWEKLGSYRGDAAFSTWLHRLAVNVVLQERRSSSRRMAREKASSVHGNGSSANPERADAGHDLDRAIATLPTKARMVFVLHDIEGYQHQEIAELMGTSVGTSKAQLHRARQLLREVLNG